MKRILYLLLFISVSCFSQDIKISYNPEQRFVTDLEDLLTTEQEQELNHILSDYEQKTTVEIAVLTTSDYEGYGDIGDYAVRLGEKWGVGKKDVDNGLMIVISKANNENFVATGYGLEGYLTDAFTHRMQDSLFIPNFKEGKYYEGLTLYVNSCKEKIGDEYSEKTNSTITAVRGAWEWFWGLPLWVKIILLVCYIALWIWNPWLAWYLTLFPIRIALLVVSRGKFGGGSFGGGGSRS